MKKLLTALALITVLLAALTPAQAAAAKQFKDVKPKHWAYDSVQWAYKKGLTSGYADGTFKPDKTITESQFVNMLVSFDCTSKKSFPAKKGEHKAMGNYRYLGKHFMPLNGYTKKKSLDAPVRNDLAARIIAAYQGYDLSRAQAVFYLYSNDLASGRTGKNDYEDFAPSQKLTRAEAVSLIHRMSLQGKASCGLKGLKKKASGADNSKFKFPGNFVDDGNESFQKPTQPKPGNKPKPETKPNPDNNANAKPAKPTDIVIDKSKLVANGVDSTYVTFTFHDANGKPIPYDEEIPFTVTSSAGAGLDEKITWKPSEGIIFPDLLPPPEKEEEYFYLYIDGLYYKFKYDENKTIDQYVKGEEIEILPSVPDDLSVMGAARSSLSAKSAFPFNQNKEEIVSDGPELIIKVTAPPSGEKLEDTITVIPGKLPNGYKLSSTSVKLTYEAKAELYLEVEEVEGVDKKSNLKAMLVYPGGKTATEFNGRMRLGKSSIPELSSKTITLTKGFGLVEFTTPEVAFNEDITAAVLPPDGYVNKELDPAIDKWYTLPYSYSPPIQADDTCTIENPEIAFVIDSSGSMKKNDPDLLRVKKSKEFIKALGSDQNITSHFTTSGMFLDYGEPDRVVPGLDKVKQNGGTSIANGLKTAINKFTTNREKVIVLLTDGKSAETPILQQAIDARNKGIKIYTIGLGEQLNTDVLKKISNDTGGAYFSIKDTTELPIVYQTILGAIKCHIPIDTCSKSERAFESADVEVRGSDFLMSAELAEGCGEIDKVIVRFTSLAGDLDYELLHRGQDYYTLTKGYYEIKDFDLSKTAKFLAYNKYGNLIGEKEVLIKNY